MSRASEHRKKPTEKTSSDFHGRLNAKIVAIAQRAADEPLLLHGTFQHSNSSIGKIIRELDKPRRQTG